MLLLAPYRLVVRSVRRFHVEGCTQTAAALSFETLLGLVPMMFVAFAVVSQIPTAVGLGAVLEKFLLANLLPDRAGVIIAKYLGQFVSRAGRITLLGVGVLAVTALMQMLTIERAFNVIWRVKTPRPLLKRILLHGTGLLLGPVAFGASLTAISFVVSRSLGLVDEPPWVDALVFRVGVPFLSMATLFGVLFWAVPNKPVMPWHAGFGGAIAALGFIGLQKLFAIYIVSFTTNVIVYGAFSAIPVFLAWLYLSWSLILVGALMVAELPNSARP